MKPENVYQNNAFEGIFLFLKIIWRNKLSRCGLMILTMLILMAVIGPIVLPAPKSDYKNRLQGPSLEHLLGTDFAGKDTLTQFVRGSKDVLLVAVYAAIFSISFSCIVGITSGYLGGKIDTILSILMDVIITIPSLPLLMILTLIIKINNPLLFGVVLSITSWASLGRAIRNQVLYIKHKDFIEASRVLGLSTFNIIARELFPNLLSFVAVYFIAVMRNSVIASVTIMLLGLAPFKGEHWGVMLNMSIQQSGALAGGPALIYFFVSIFGMIIFQLGCYLFANGIDEAMNPRLRD